MRAKDHKLSQEHTSTIRAYCARSCGTRDIDMTYIGTHAAKYESTEDATLLGRRQHVSVFAMVGRKAILAQVDQSTNRHDIRKTLTGLSNYLRTAPFASNPPHRRRPQCPARLHYHAHGDIPDQSKSLHDHRGEIAGLPNYIHTAPLQPNTPHRCRPQCPARPPTTHTAEDFCFLVYTCPATSPETCENQIFHQGVKIFATQVKN